MPNYLSGQVIYTSRGIRKAIIDLFRSNSGRRIAISAFVGRGAEALLPRPKGLELICWPKVGGTNPQVLRELIKKGVRVRFSDSLHMKLYWSEGVGSIITSANLSNSALGSGNLREFGIKLPASAVDISRVLQAINPRPVGSELQKLDKSDREYRRSNPSGRMDRRKQYSFPDWLESPHREVWKIARYEVDPSYNLADSSRNRIKKEYGRTRAGDFLGTSYGEFGRDDWLLEFESKKPSRVDWLYVDFVERLPKGDTMYDKDEPYQSVQIWPSNRYPAPPFKIDRAFRDAFARAVKSLGRKGEELDGKKPSRRLLAIIQKNYK